MQTDEVLAIARLRQWAADRCALSASRTVDLRAGSDSRSGRRACRFDARLVRVIDFERALNSLEPAQVTALVLTYRDKEDGAAIAKILGCSLRTVCNLVPAARLKLADVLGRLDLL